jgi:Tetracyclin repressor-like, C-terminal domain
MMLFGMINYTYTWYDAKGPIKPKAFAQLAAGLFLKGFLADSPARPTEDSRTPRVGAGEVRRQDSRA